MPRDLSSLSPELQINILQSLSSPKDLYALIKASPLFHRVFATYKCSIQSTILLNAIPQVVEVEFILAHRAQGIWKMMIPEEDTQISSSFEERQKFYDGIMSECGAIIHRFVFWRNVLRRRPRRLYELVSDDHTLLQDMWRLYCSFEHLMIDYSKRALSNLRQSSSCDSGSNKLSFIERARLQRAFFSWEIYTCLFQLTQVSSYNQRISAAFTPPAASFAKMLRSWEIEEMCCVAQFYKVLVEELCGRIEEDFVALTKKKMDACTRDSCGDGGTNSLRQLETLGQRILEMNHLEWYSESCKGNLRSRHIDSLVSRGMLSVRKLTAKEPFPLVRKMVVTSTHKAQVSIRMLRGLTDLKPLEGKKDEEDDEERFGERYPAENDLDPDSVDISLRRCNFGWKWAFGESVGLNLPANYELRDQGYVFWDKERMLAFEKFRSPRRRPVVFEKFPPGHQKHSQRPGVETLLKDVPVYWKVIEEISLEIHGGKA